MNKKNKYKQISGEVYIYTLYNNCHVSIHNKKQNKQIWISKILFLFKFNNLLLTSYNSKFWFYWFNVCQYLYIN